MQEGKKEEYKMRMRMIEEDLVDHYEDILFNTHISTVFRYNDLSQVVDGTAICAVPKGKYTYRSII